MNSSPNKQQKKIELASFRLFAEKISMFLKPAKPNQLDIAAIETIRLDSVVVIDMGAAQPLVEAFCHVKLISRRDKSRISVLVTKVHSEAQAQSVFKKLAVLCESFINVELHYLGGVPSDSLLKSFDQSGNEKQKEEPALPDTGGSRPKAKGHLDFIQEYWTQTHSSIRVKPIMAVAREN